MESIPIYMESISKSSEPIKIDLVIPADKSRKYTLPENSQKTKKKKKCGQRKKCFLHAFLIVIIIAIFTLGIIMILNYFGSGPNLKPNPNPPNPKPNHHPTPGHRPVPSQEDLEFVKIFPGLLSQNGRDSCFVIDAVNILWNTNLRVKVPTWKINEIINPRAPKASAAFAFQELFSTDDANIRFKYIQQLRTTVRNFRGNIPYYSDFQDGIKFMGDLLNTMAHEKGLSQKDILDYEHRLCNQSEIYDSHLADLVSSMERNPEVVIFETMSHAPGKFKTSENFIVDRENAIYQLASISGGTANHYVPFLRDYRGTGKWISLSFGKREVYKTLADVRTTSDGGYGENGRGGHAYIYVKTN